MSDAFDLIIRNARGTDGAPLAVAVRDGRIAAMGAAVWTTVLRLDTSKASRCSRGKAMRAAE